MKHTIRLARFAVVLSALHGPSAAHSPNGVPVGLASSDGSIPVDAHASGQGVADAIAQQAYLKASNTGPSDRFGSQVAVFGDTVVVGAALEDGAGTGTSGDPLDDSAKDAGAVYVFVRDGASWRQDAYLKASNTDAFDGFGWSVAIDGDTIVVGAEGEDSAATGVNGNPFDESAPSSGAAYVFVREAGEWVQQAYLKASNTGAGDAFGTTVAISGDTIVVGAYREDSAATGVDGNGADDSASDSGAAYVFVRQGTTWTQAAYLKAVNTGANDWFSISLDVDRDAVAVGARAEASDATGVNGDPFNDDALGSGAAYVFRRNGSSWSSEAYLKSSNSEATDAFGTGVALFGDTLVVTAQNESSQATGVDGDQSDNSVSAAGAAYVFARDASGSWSQEAYLKASNPDPLDRFGYSVTAFDDTVVVGARGEQSLATGVDGNQANNDDDLVGAAYVFRRDVSGLWSQEAYLKASNSARWYTFGVSVALSGDALVVGSPWEQSLATGVNGDQADMSGGFAGAAYAFDLAAWTNAGCSLAGVAGDPVLVGTGKLELGSSNAVALSYAAPGAACALFLSLVGTPTPFMGGTLKAFPPLVRPFLFVTSSSGTQQFSFEMPQALPPGTNLWWQFVIADSASSGGVALSNAVRGTVP